MFLFPYAAPHLNFSFTLMEEDWRKQSIIEVENFFKFLLYTYFIWEFRKRNPKDNTILLWLVDLASIWIRTHSTNVAKLLPHSEFRSQLLLD